jgi:WD40 repeat protein
VILYNSDTGQALPSPVLAHSVGSEATLNASRDGAMLAAVDTYPTTASTGLKSRVALWNLRTGQKVRHIENSYETTELVAIAPDKSLLVTGSSRGGGSSAKSYSIRLWRLK